MPAEWEAHEATWLTWPHDEAHWPGKFERIPSIWARMAKELEAGEDVHIIIHDKATRAVTDKELERAGVNGRRVHLHDFANNFSWARDHGPIFVKNTEGKRLITHWKYNAWGGKWAHDLDRNIPEEVARWTGIPRAQCPQVLEGGSIDVNGAGTILTTESCLLHPNRNPNLTREEIEKNLCDYLGVTKVLWLGEGIEGDDTDGHVDDLTRFVEARTVVTMIEESSSDLNYKPLHENVKRLSKMTDQAGKALEILEIPLPAPIHYDGMRLPASYANFYVGNEVVLLPVFQDPNDQRAVDTLERIFPNRKIVAIDARDLIWGLGAFHCVTQQQPA